MMTITRIFAVKKLVVFVEIPKTGIKKRIPFPFNSHCSIQQYNLHKNL